MVEETRNQRNGFRQPPDLMLLALQVIPWRKMREADSWNFGRLHLDPKDKWVRRKTP